MSFLWTCETSFQIGAFEREGDNYTWFMPTLQKLRKDKNMKRLSLANCFYASTEKCILVLDNLKVKGFDVIKKQPERKFHLTALKNVLSISFFWYFSSTHCWISSDGVDRTCSFACHWILLLYNSPWWRREACKGPPLSIYQKVYGRYQWWGLSYINCH